MLSCAQCEQCTVVVLAFKLIIYYTYSPMYLSFRVCNVKTTIFSTTARLINLRHLSCQLDLSTTSSTWYVPRPGSG